MYDQVTLKLNVDPWILSALKEDITSEDVSTNSVMPHPQAGEVDLICKEDGIICGLQVFERVFTLLDEKTTVEFLVQDGAEVHKGQLMAKVHGDIRTLLCGERTALNYLQRMSGIATYTHSVAELLKGTGIKLLDTRKTTPNNRIFEKYAVRIGGGNNHRYNLSDGVLLKDNHIGAAGGVKEAIAAAKEYAPFVRKIEVEVESLDIAEKELSNIITPDKPREITPQLIIEVVSEHYHISVDQMISKTRSSDVAKPRQIAMYLCKNMTESPLDTIGSLLGGRDHSTIIHGIKKVTEEYEKNETTRNMIETIKKKINPN